MSISALGSKQQEKSSGGISFDDLLKSTVTDKPTSKKKEVPVIADVPEEVKKSVDDYLSAKEIKKSAEAQLDLLGAMIGGFVKAYQDREGFKGHFRNSFKVPGVHKTLTYVSSNRWTINPQDYPNLKSLLGDEADRLLKVKWTVKLKDEVLENEALKDKLMQLVGDAFGEFFVSEAKVSVSEDFDQAIYSVLGKDDLGDLRTFAKQYSASLR